MVNQTASTIQIAQLPTAHNRTILLGTICTTLSAPDEAGLALALALFTAAVGKEVDGLPEVEYTLEDVTAVPTPVELGAADAATVAEGVGRLKLILAAAQKD